MGMKQQILAVIDDWISQCNDDINHEPDHGKLWSDTSAERILREGYDRKIALVKFKLAFQQDIYNGPKAICLDTLAGVVEHICEMERTGD